MRAKLAFVFVIVLLGVLLLWQTEKKGKLKQEIKGYVRTIETMVEYENQRIEQDRIDDLILAKTSESHRQVIRDNNELRRQLGELEGCSAAYIAPDTVERVQQFRSKNGIYPRPSASEPY